MKSSVSPGEGKASGGMRVGADVAVGSGVGTDVVVGSGLGLGVGTRKE
jgi:hypothetical protein